MAVDIPPDIVRAGIASVAWGVTMGGLRFAVVRAVRRGRLSAAYGALALGAWLVWIPILPPLVLEQRPDLRGPVAIGLACGVLGLLGFWAMLRGLDRQD